VFYEEVAWINIEEKRIESITTLTCDSSSNHIVAAIHDRMPVILADPDVQRAWLDPSVGAAEALELCWRLPADRMRTQPANPAVNKAGGVEGPELLSVPATRCNCAAPTIAKNAANPRCRVPLSEVAGYLWKQTRRVSSATLLTRLEPS